MGEWIKKSKVYLSTAAPHENSASLPSDMWKDDRGMLSAQWTDLFDTPTEMPWWYCLLDHPISLEEMNSKKRYEVKKGLKGYSVAPIDPSEYAAELADITLEEWATYDAAYRPDRSREGLIKIFGNHAKRSELEYWGVFSLESGRLCGFANCANHGDWIDFMSLKVPASHQRKNATYALVYTLSEHYMNTEGIRYICDGHRNVVHQTNFQQWLVSNFGYRYAYARLNVAYRPLFSGLVKVVYPFRSLVKKIPKLYKVSVLLKYEEIARECRKISSRQGEKDE